MEHEATNAEANLDDAISALQEESKILDNDSPSTTATRFIEQNAPFAAVSLVHLARNAFSETVRLNATKEILARTLGPASEQQSAGSKDPFEQFVEKMEAAFTTNPDKSQAVQQASQAEHPVKREA